MTFNLGLAKLIMALVISEILCSSQKKSKKALPVLT